MRKKKRRRRGSFGRSVLLLVALSLAVVILLVSISTCRRGKAAADALWDGGWYADDLGRIRGEKKLLSGMKAFRRQTGERPYLALLSGVEPGALKAFARDQYEALFAAGGHVLVVYDEWEDGTYYLAAQTDPASPLTGADLDTLLNCLEGAYADGRYDSYEAAFGAGFKAAAGQMSVRKGGAGTVILLSLAAVLALLGTVLLSILRRNARRARRAALEMEPEE